MKHHREKGAVLVISLLMLIVLTLLAVSAINTGTINLRVAGNMQAQTRVELATRQAIEGLRAKGIQVELVVVKGLTHYQTQGFVDPLENAVRWLRRLWAVEP